MNDPVKKDNDVEISKVSIYLDDKIHEWMIDRKYLW